MDDDENIVNINIAIVARELLWLFNVTRELVDISSHGSPNYDMFDSYDSAAQVLSNKRKDLIIMNPSGLPHFSNSESSKRLAISTPEAFTKYSSQLLTDIIRAENSPNKDTPVLLLHSIHHYDTNNYAKFLSEGANKIMPTFPSEKYVAVIKELLQI